MQCRWFDECCSIPEKSPVTRVSRCNDFEEHEYVRSPEEEIALKEKCYLCWESSSVVMEEKSNA